MGEKMGDEVSILLQDGTELAGVLAGEGANRSLALKEIYSKVGANLENATILNAFLETVTRNRCRAVDSPAGVYFVATQASWDGKEEKT